MTFVGKSSSTEPFVTKQRSSSLRKNRSSSPTSGIKISMTLSGLLSSKSDNSNHSHTTSSDLSLTKDKIESEQFYDIDSQDSITDAKCLKSQSTDAKEQSIPSKPDSEDEQKETPVHKYITITIWTVAYLIILLPSFMSGLLLRVALMYCVLQAYQCLCVPLKPKDPFIVLDLSTLPPLVVPEMKESQKHRQQILGNTGCVCACVCVCVFLPVCKIK